MSLPITLWLNIRVLCFLCLLPPALLPLRRRGQGQHDPLQEHGEGRAGLFRIRDDLRYVLSMKNEKLFIKLEEANNLETKNMLCKFLDIKFDKKIMTATIATIPWHGDRLSKEKSTKGEYILFLN